MVDCTSFGRHAKRYDEVRPDFGDFPGEFVQSVTDGVPSDHDLSFLELGSGTGINTLQMLAALGNRAYSFTAFEPDERMTVVARKKLGSLKHNVCFVPSKFQADYSGQLADTSFDAVVAANSWPYLWQMQSKDTSEERRLYEQIHRLLKPAGHLALLGNMRPVSDEKGDGFYKAYQRLWLEYLGVSLPEASRIISPPNISSMRLRASDNAGGLFRADEKISGSTLRVDHLDAEALWQRVSTYSTVIAMPNRRKGAFHAKLVKLVNEQFSGKVDLTCATVMLVLQKI